MAVGEIIMPERSLKVASSAALGAFRSNFTVLSSTTSTSLTDDISAARKDFVFGSIMRSKFALTAAALKSVPSWNLTPLRSVKTSVVGSV